MKDRGEHEADTYIFEALLDLWRAQVYPYPQSVQNVQYIDDNGNEVDVEVLRPWLKNSGYSNTARGDARKAADAPFRLFKMESVKAMRLYHEEVTF